MKLVVTGATGHICSYLVRDLPYQFPGVEIVMIDNLLTQRFASLFDLPAAGVYRFVEADVTTADMRPLLQDAHTVVHLAATTDAAGSVERAEAMEANKYAGTANVAHACVETGARFIGISSTSVYGTRHSVVSEDCAPDGGHIRGPLPRRHD